MKTRFNLVACIAMVLVIMCSFGFVSCGDSEEPEYVDVAIKTSTGSTSATLSYAMREVTLTASIAHGDSAKGVTWSAVGNTTDSITNDADKLVLTPNGNSCTVKVKDGWEFENDITAYVYATSVEDNYRYGKFPITIEKVKLVKFNAAETVFSETDMEIKGSASSGGKEGYLVFNHKIDPENDNIIVEADVKFSSLSGHNGLGFISVSGSDRKGYSMLTGQNIKNVSCTLGGGGNGLNPSVSWAVDTGYHFKATFDGASNATPGSTTCVVYEVYDEAGTTLLGSNTTPFYHSADDTAYIALGGTNTGNVTYSNVKVTIDSVKYSIGGLDEQAVLPSLSVSASQLRVMLNDTGTITYVATKVGGNSSAVKLDYDTSLLTVVDNGTGTLSITGKAATTGTTLTITNSSTEYLKFPVTVVVEDYATSDEYGTLNVYPANNATAAYTDGEFRLTFDAAPTVSATGSISIYDSDGNCVDTIKAAEEIQTPITGNEIKVKDQMIRVSGNSVYFTAHFGVLEASKAYYVAIPKDVITGTINSKTFIGLTNNKDNASWKFTTRAAPTVGSTITVDGAETATADFRTVYGALEAIGATSGDFTINVAAGTYRELVHFNGSANITIAGPANTRGEGCTIQYTNMNKWNGSMDTRASMFFGSSAGNVVLKNLTIQNTTSREALGTTADTQAEAVYYKSSKTIAAYNCSFKSYQDTICTRGKAWFYDCYIEGDTDFIWGYSDVALFEECDLKCLNDEYKTNSKDSILFVARVGTKTATKIGKGYVLLNSTVTLEDGMNAFFARNAGSGDFYDQVAIVNTSFTGANDTTPWSGSTYDFLADKADKVGCKYYNVTGDVDTTTNNTNVGEITAADYAKEFNGRRAILNRVYSIEDAAYAAATVAWDLTSLESDFSATTDASASNVYDEAVSNRTEYDFKDGTIQSAGGVTGVFTTDSGYHGTSYGLDMKAGKTIVLSVSGSCAVTFVGSIHSSLDMVCTDGAGNIIGTEYTKVTNDCVDTYGFMYNGAATTLTFTATLHEGAGSDIYLPIMYVFD